MERLRKLRQNMGVTQEQLADDLSVAKSTIGMWENQKREPDLKMLEKIADFFKTSVDYLIGSTAFSEVSAPICFRPRFWNAVTEIQKKRLKSGTRCMT